MHRIARYSLIIPTLVGITMLVAPVRSGMADDARQIIASPFPAINTALSRVSSFHVDVTVTQRRGISHAAITAVRYGAAFAYHAVVRQPSDTGASPFVEIVLRGSRTCVRTTRQGLYQCRVATLLAARVRADLDNLDSMWEFAHPPATRVFSLALVQRIDGRACVGYTFHPAGTTEPETDTLYITKASQLPCELLQKGTTGGATSTWSHFNDPSMAIPRIAGVQVA